MSDIGIHTDNEIRTSPEAWSSTLAMIDANVEQGRQLWKEAEEVVIAGCGSGQNAACAIAPFWQTLSGKTCRAVHASQLFLHRDSCLNGNRRTLVVLFSRSGATTESCRAQQAAIDAGAATIAVTCFADSWMARHADLALVLDGAGEKSITTTRSFTSMILAGNYLAAVCEDRQEMIDGFRTLPDSAAARMNEFDTLGRRISEDAEIAKYAFLGSGTHYGLAREAQLKVKEMVLLPADSYVSLDYRHGPKSNVDEAMLVTLFGSDAGTEYDGELGRDMRKLGGKVFIIADTTAAAEVAGADYRIALGSGHGDGVRDILYMPAVQFFAFYKSIAVGCDPDNPHNLSYHVDLG